MDLITLSKMRVPVSDLDHMNGMTDNRNLRVERDATMRTELDIRCYEKPNAEPITNPIASASRCSAHAMMIFGDVGTDKGRSAMYPG